MYAPVSPPTLPTDKADVQVCLGLISICLPFMEGAAPFHDLHRVGAPILIVNGMIAFCLNVAGVFLIDSAGSLVLTLSGVGKVRLSS
jgi:hypothetical protein